MALDKLLFKGTGYTGILYAILDKGNNFCGILYIFLHTKPLFGKAVLRDKGLL